MTRPKPPIPLRFRATTRGPRNARVVPLRVWLGLALLTATGGAGQDATVGESANTRLGAFEFDRLLRTLDEPDGSPLRIEASRALGESGDPRAVDPLLKAVRYATDRDFEEAVCRALGQLGDRRAAEYLIGMLRDSDLAVRVAAVESLGLLKDSKAVAPLLRNLENPDPVEREAVALALGRIGDTRAMESLLALLRDKDTRLSEAASFALAGMGGAAVPPLLLVLKDPDAEIRRRGALVLARLRAENAFAPLILALEDPESWEHREGAALALMDWGGIRAVEPLARALKDPQPEVRDAAALSLGSLGNPRAVAPLAEALGDSHEQVRHRAAFSLAVLGDGRGQEALLESVRKEEKVESRKAAAIILGSLGERGIPPLLLAMRDPDPGVRLAAIEGLGASGSGPAATALIEALRQSDSADRAAASKALVRIGCSGALPLLKALKDADHVFRDAVIEILVAMKDPALHPLIEALKDPDWFVRAGAAAALGNLGRSAAAVPLLQALDDKDWQVRQSAIVALGKLGDKRAVEPVIGKLSDMTTRFESIEALGRLGDDRAVLPLIEELKGTAIVRKAAADALARLGDARAVDPLISLLEAGGGESDGSVRGGVARALGRLGDARAIDPLVSLLADAEAEVRRLAAEALGELGEAAVAPLIETLEGADAVAREGAVVALVKLGEPALAPALDIVASSSDEGAREAAAATLAGLGDLSVAPLLAKYLDGPDRIIRRRALAALSGLPRTPRFLSALSVPASSWNPVSRIRLGRLFVSDMNPFTRSYLTLAAKVVASPASLVYGVALVLFGGVPLGLFWRATASDNGWWTPGWAGWACAGSLFASTLLYGWTVFAGAGGWILMLASLAPLWLALAGAMVQGLIRWPRAWSRAAKYVCRTDLCRFLPRPKTWLFRWSGGALLYEDGWNGDLAETCACRVCGEQDRKLLGVKRIVAVLDNKSRKLLDQNRDDLRVNWLVHRKPFDLEAVELGSVDDADVEAFTNQMRFESDEEVSSRLLGIVCRVKMAQPLKEGTMRLLKLTFRRVVKE